MTDEFETADQPVKRGPGRPPKSESEPKMPERAILVRCNHYKIHTSIGRLVAGHQDYLPRSEAEKLASTPDPDNPARMMVDIVRDRYSGEPVTQ